MDAPLCRICGSKHYGMDHRFKDEIVEPASNDVLVASNIEPIASNKQRWSREKYNEYQKEYMKRRRMTRKERNG